VGSATLAPPRPQSPIVRLREAPRAAGTRITGWVLAGLVGAGIALRCWDLGGRPLNLDESFEALTARRPIGELFGYLAHHDTAPPLTYLLRAPFVAISQSDVMARLPSVLCSCAALALFAWWMRRRGIFGVVGVALFAFDAFQIHYGREARMYALLELVGVVGAMVAEAWLRSPRRAHLVLVAAFGTVAVFTHVAAFLFLAGLLTLVGTRRDRDAWWWRAALAVPGLLFAALWGPQFLQQLHNDHQPGARTSWHALADVVGSQVTTDTALHGLLFVAVAVGGVVLVRKHRVLGRVWLACFVAPLVAAAVLGLATDFLLPRVLTLGAWGPLVALAVLVEEAAARWRALGVAAAAVVLVVVVCAGVREPGRAGPADAAVAQLRVVTRPGDVVAVRPFWLEPLIDWNLGTREPQPPAQTRNSVIPDAHELVVGGRAPTGRVWLLEPVDDRWFARDSDACAPPWSDGVSRLRCLIR